MLKEVKVTVKYPFPQIDSQDFYTYVPEEELNDLDSAVTCDVIDFLLEEISFSCELTGEEMEDEED